jgi:hypothetical protein
MTNTDEPADWAGTRLNMYELHRFDTDQRALCDPMVRTHSRTTPDDWSREPYSTLRTRGQIEATGFAHMYRFCSECTERPRQSEETPGKVLQFTRRSIRSNEEKGDLVYCPCGEAWWVLPDGAICFGTDLTVSGWAGIPRCKSCGEPMNIV